MSVVRWKMKIADDGEMIDVVSKPVDFLVYDEKFGGQELSAARQSFAIMYVAAQRLGAVDADMTFEGFLDALSDFEPVEDDPKASG